MSRFFAGSDSESESSSNEEVEVTAKSQPLTAQFTFSDEEEETKRVVRSTKEKRFEDLMEIIKQIKNHKKIKDMSKLLTSFENLTKALNKAKPVIDKEAAGVIPKFYIRCLVELEDFINDCWEDREGRKSMSKNNSKSLATLRQKLRKYNKDFESQISEYRENPEAEDEDRDDDEESGSEDDDDSEITKDDKEDGRGKILKPGSDEDEDSEADSFDWGSSDSESESELSSDDEKYGGNLSMKFLKKPSDKDEVDTKKRDKKRSSDKKSRKRDENDGWTTVRDGAPLIIEVPKMFAKDAEINHGLVQKKLQEILAARGKKGTDRSEQIELLGELLNISKTHELGPAMEVKIIFAVVAAIFDYNPNIATCMKTEVWQKCLENVNLLLDLLTVNSHHLTVGEHVAEDSEVLAVTPYRVRGCILTVVERLDEEFTKMLQGCDAHSPEYVERLKDEKTVCNIIQRLQDYLEGKGTSSELCRIYLRNIEHIYYKFDSRVLEQRERKKNLTVVGGMLSAANENETEKKDESPEEKAIEITETETSLDDMARLCKFIYAKDNTDRIRTQTMLCHIYHHALHDNWFEARDLMLMSHLQDSIHHSDPPTQILYNRALVQLGLCAFRHGNIKDAHNALLEIQSGGRAKELLAQGLLPQRQHERTSEQEKIEKRRQMPFHKHINLELLECVYLVSAMLLEIPYMAAHELEGRKRMISKSFHHQLRNSERQALVGPPESMREHVVAASKAMRVGNWRNCRNYVVNEKMNSKVWDLFHQAEKVRLMIAQKIQEEALRTYLFTYSAVYDSLSMDVLAETFELDKSVVHSIISKMIINEELMASMDEPTQTVVMHRTEPSRIQALALQLADKMSNLCDQNDRLWELKQGSFFGRNQGGYGRNDGYQKSGYGGQQDRGWGRRQRNNY